MLFLFCLKIWKMRINSACVLLLRRAELSLKVIRQKIIVCLTHIDLQLLITWNSYMHKYIVKLNRWINMCQHFLNVGCYPLCVKWWNFDWAGNHIDCKKKKPVNERQKRKKKSPNDRYFATYCWHWRPWHCPCSESLCFSCDTLCLSMWTRLNGKLNGIYMMT